MTTVPNPFITKARSSGSRGRWCGLWTVVFIARKEKFAAKLVKPLAGIGAYGENSGMVAIKKRALEECFYLQADLFETAWADGVNLGDHGKAAADTKQAADGEMLLGRIRRAE